MKVEHEVKLGRNEMSTLRRTCGFHLKRRKENTEPRELLGLEPVSLLIRRGRLRWFEHVEQKDGTDWVKRCMMMDIMGD